MKKLISILGDSISTLEGWNPPGHAVFYDAPTARKGGLRDVSDTWWHQVIQSCGCALCVNNSYSGSRASGADFPSAWTHARTGQLHSDRNRPDYVLVYIGFNDFGYGVPIQNPRRLHLKKDPRYFLDAYCLMIRNIRSHYPSAQIHCATLLRGYSASNPSRRFPENFNGHTPLSEYNAAIRTACRRTGAVLLDLAHSDHSFETIDGSHPTAKGHREFARCWIEAIQTAK